MKLYIAGFGPGDEQNMTLAAREAVLQSDLVVGYTTYVKLMAQLFPEKTYVSTGMTKERDRVAYAIEQVLSGRQVTLICSGDSAVYGMAGLAIEMADGDPKIEIVVVPGVTAALSGGAVLGAPLTHDFCVISLSDLLTPWETIKKRLTCAAMGDFTIAIYNPSSKKRADYLAKACEIMLAYKKPDTVCGVVKNIGRAGQESRILPLCELQHLDVDMFTTVFIGNQETKTVGGKMVTPRGYQNKR